MKRFSKLIITLTILMLVPLTANAQCKGFAKKICKIELMPYIHDGNYHAAVLTEGEEAELYKTFYSGQEYRIAVCGSDNLPNIEFKVIDQNRNVLYNNKDNNYSRTWDFKLETSQQLKIWVKVPVRSDATDEIRSGCVAIMFGFKNK
ncbi:MAG TPA: hypothetical protein VE912_06795 [Bacteroidales bacterium]|nr:hypothetical protein [Bacteroidales bacterium]